ncbi:MAG: PTS sugar transporter subunit IIA [Spirochaetes bacterium]|nr:PTS sugar transporter subunit IIA [Spirochaetota bacterium]MBN2772278.1 PTS sugar transporter subunit IIA [Spirochaetota bacterium]
MELKDILDTSLCRVDFSAKNKEAALDKIASIASKSAHFKNISKSEILSGIIEREELGSTGFGDGIAIPHARLKNLDDFVVFVLVSPKGIDFDSLDRRKTRIFCVILAPDEKVNEHLEILASFSRMLSISAMRREILSSRTAEIIYETIVRHSSGHARTNPNAVMKMIIIILYYEEFMHPVLEHLVENGVKGASIIESAGMGSYISAIPLFASFLGFMRDDKNKSKTILALIPDELEETIFEGIERITGDLDKKEGAMIMTFAISRFRGTMEIM